MEGGAAFAVKVGELTYFGETFLDASGLAGCKCLCDDFGRDDLIAPVVVTHEFSLVVHDAPLRGLYLSVLGCHL